MKNKDINKDSNKEYNTTDLDPKSAFERHVFHRDQFAHFLRWSHVLKFINARKDRTKLTVTDFGCGKGYMGEVLYRNRLSVGLYQGVDIRKQTIKSNSERFSKVLWMEFLQADLIKDSLESLAPADVVCSFEVIEHIGKENANTFLKKFKDCGKDDATYYLSTPNFDEKVGPAQNHIYNGKINEFAHSELETEIDKAGFKVEQKFGTFASIKDYKKELTEEQLKIFEQFKEYYDVNLISVIFAPLFPELSRNCLWVLKRK